MNIMKSISSFFKNKNVKRAVFFILFVVVLLIMSQFLKVDEPKIGVSLMDPYLDDGATTLRYSVTNYEDHPIQFKNHKAMQGVIREFSSEQQMSYDCPEEVVEIPANEKYIFSIDLTDFPAGSYDATFSAASSGTCSTHHRQFKLPLD